MVFASLEGELTSVRTFLFRFVRGWLGALAKLEFHWWADGHEKNQFFRRLYMRAMGVRHGVNLYCGPDIMIRMRGGITLGERCSLGYSTHLWNYDQITIGCDFVAAPGLTITTGGHDPLTMEDTASAVSIGDRCWCGINVTILAGVCIGDDVVIAAGSVVTKNVLSGTLVGGVPAKPLKKLERISASYQAREWGARG